MKAKTRAAKDDLRSNYDFDYSKGMRGKYYRRAVSGSSMVVLEPDVAKVFRSSAAVNEALRSLLKMAAETRRVTLQATGKSVRKRRNGVSLRG